MTAFVILAASPGVLLLVLGLGAAHALEPDHIATMKTMASKREYLKFSLGHGLGFAMVAIPIILLFGFVRVLEVAGDLIGLGVGVLLLVEEISGKEFEVKGGGMGVAQGALALTPSKVLVAVLAAEAGLLLGSVYIALFIVISSSLMYVLAIALTYVPTRASKVVGIAVALATIAFVLYTMLR
ncbi:hypothetical protein [Sulfodiicoccus acidiphilus]|uniref:hypothetical protein n=1 Tax=Sulfodiicoccus acidiphilus TaxID=1670455 RepID=UPI000F82F0B6|nr:hypothetical protein [Sulfodiicoccus acidiphilus]